MTRPELYPSAGPMASEEEICLTSPDLGIPSGTLVRSDQGLYGVIFDEVFI